jgi:curved DNA-binding protein CbpA
MGDLYEILGVSRKAAAAEVRKAYLQLAKEHHPDRFADPVEKAKAQEFFKGLTEAFNTLSNERSRREYDAELERPKLTTPEEIGRDAYARGLKHFEAKEYHEAVELFRTAVHVLPGEAKLHAALARTLAKNPHWLRDAIQSLEKAVQLAPKQAVYHAELAMLFHGEGLKLRAHKAIEAALALGPRDAEVQRIAGLIGSGSDEAPK